MTELHILLGIALVLSIILMGAFIYIMKNIIHTYVAMIKADNDSIVAMDDYRTMKGDIYTDAEIKSGKFNFKEDFDNNIVPIIDQQIKHFITYKFLPNLDRSADNGQLPSDTFVKKYIEEFTVPLLMDVSVTMKKYFTKYMPAENFERYIAATAYNDLLMACGDFERKVKKNK